MFSIYRQWAPVVTVSMSWVALKSSHKQTNLTQILCLSKVSVENDFQVNRHLSK